MWHWMVQFARLSKVESKSKKDCRRYTGQNVITAHGQNGSRLFESVKFPGAICHSRSYTSFHESLRRVEVKPLIFGEHELVAPLCCFEILVFLMKETLGDGPFSGACHDSCLNKLNESVHRERHDPGRALSILSRLYTIAPYWISEFLHNARKLCCFARIFFVSFRALRVNRGLPPSMVNFSLLFYIPATAGNDRDNRVY